VLRQPDDAAVAEFAEQGDVGLAYRAAQVARAREPLGVVEEVCRGLVGFEPLAEDYARAALQLERLRRARAPRPGAPGDEGDGGEAEREDEDLRELRGARAFARLDPRRVRQVLNNPFEDVPDEALERVAALRAAVELRVAQYGVQATALGVLVLLRLSAALGLKLREPRVERAQARGCRAKRQRALVFARRVPVLFEQRVEPGVVNLKHTACPLDFFFRWQKGAHALRSPAKEAAGAARRAARWRGAGLCSAECSSALAARRVNSGRRTYGAPSSRPRRGARSALKAPGLSRATSPPRAVARACPA